MKNGDKINKWIIIEEHYESKYGKKYSLVQCECGNKKIVQKSSIIQNRSKCCRNCARSNNVNALKNKVQKKNGLIFCQGCKNYLSPTNFYNNTKNKYRDGLERSCKKCQREKQKRYTKKRRDTDPAFKLLTNLRNRMYEVIRGGYKKTKTVELLGCSPNEYKAYIESLWSEGMSWENYGNCRNCWNIDHIIPLSIFNMDYEADQKTAFHYMNTQPMWTLENIKKSNKTGGE